MTQHDDDLLRRTVSAFRGKITLTQMHRLFPQWTMRELEGAIARLSISLPTHAELTNYVTPLAAKILFDYGWTVPQIRKRLGWSHNKATLALNAAGVPRRERHRRRTNAGHQITPQEADMIWREMGKAGPGNRFATSFRLAEEIGCAASTVREVWRWRSDRSRYAPEERGEPEPTRMVGVFTLKQAIQIREQVMQFPAHERNDVIREMVGDLNREMPDLAIPIDIYDVRDAIRSAARADR